MNFGHIKHFKCVFSVLFKLTRTKVFLAWIVGQLVWVIQYSRMLSWFDFFQFTSKSSFTCSIHLCIIWF